MQGIGVSVMGRARGKEELEGEEMTVNDLCFGSHNESHEQPKGSDHVLSPPLDDVCSTST